MASLFLLECPKYCRCDRGSPVPRFAHYPDNSLPRNVRPHVPSRAKTRLTVAAETIRYCLRIYEWSGLYVPVVHFRNIANVVKEPGPYILGATAECRGLFTAPGDVSPLLQRRHLTLGFACRSRQELRYDYESSDLLHPWTTQQVHH